MGIYDTLHVELPGYEGIYQTKDLACQMASYRIDASGRLYLDGDVDAGQLSGGRFDASEAHGIVRFYTHTPDGVWVEREAKFTDGLCVAVRTATNGMGTGMGPWVETST